VLRDIGGWTRRAAEDRAELGGARRNGRSHAQKRAKACDQNQFLSEHHAARRFGLTRVYATTEERLVNTLNTAGKGRNP
jgi:hypothetical protein